MTNDTLIRAFATPIMLRRCANVDNLNRILAGTVRGLALSNPSDDYKRAHQGGFYTAGTLFESTLPGIAEIRELARRGIQDYIARVNPDHPPPVSVQIIGWAAVTRERDYQTPHVHAGATLSGVYYVAVPDKPEPEGCIDLITPIDVQEMTFLSGFSKTYCRIVPKPGDLLIFPAYCKHFTHPFFGEGERIVAVFNAFVQQQKQR
jgi:hypothetical protein